MAWVSPLVESMAMDVKVDIDVDININKHKKNLFGPCSHKGGSQAQ